MTLQRWGHVLGQPSVYLDVVLRPEIPGIDTAVAGLLDALSQVGFSLVGETDLGATQAEVSAFARDWDRQLNLGFRLSHPQLGAEVGLLCEPAWHTGAGPSGAILFSLTCVETAVLEYPRPVLTAPAADVILPFCTNAALSLPTLLIELQAQLGTSISAWDAMANGRVPEGFLLYLSPTVAHLNPGEWQHMTLLSNGGYLYLEPLRRTK